MRSNDDRLRIARETVGAASRAARAVQQDLASIRQITKDDRSPVTVADFAVQAIIALELRDKLGETHIVGEEDAEALRGTGQEAIRCALLDAVRRHRPGIDLDQVLDAIDLCNHDATSDCYWTLDPVDGTKGFLRGQQYAIALALIERGTVTLGVMGCPNLPLDPGASLDDADARGCLYSAARGGGAREHEPTALTAPGRPVHAARFAPGRRIRTCGSVEKAHSRQSDMQLILDRLGEVCAPVRLDSQCKYALVARGQADAYFRMPTGAAYVEKIWDHAAGSLIAAEAGAVVSDITGRPLDFSLGSTLSANRGVICASAGLHERIIQAIDELGLAARPGAAAG
jgi:3'(2'), 5'-bisphosphate nucleotidase